MHWPNSPKTDAKFQPLSIDSASTEAPATPFRAGACNASGPRIQIETQIPCLGFIRPLYWHNCVWVTVALACHKCPWFTLITHTSNQHVDKTPAEDSRWHVGVTSCKATMICAPQMITCACMRTPRMRRWVVAGKTCHVNARSGFWGGLLGWHQGDARPIMLTPHHATAVRVLA